MSTIETNQDSSPWMRKRTLITVGIGLVVTVLATALLMAAVARVRDSADRSR